MPWPAGLTREDLPGYLEDLARDPAFTGAVLFPLDDDHVRMVSRHRERLSRHYLLTTPGWDQVRHLYNKRLTCDLARQAGVPVPHTYPPMSLEDARTADLAWPVVLKPTVKSRLVGTTQRKAFRADDARSFLKVFEKMCTTMVSREILVQAFLPNPAANLYSFGGIFREGKPVVGVTVKRSRQWPIDFGRVSSFVEARKIDVLRDSSAQLLQVIGYTGLAEVEFMWDQAAGCFRMLEVNARLWGWHGLAPAGGLDLPYYAACAAAGRPAKHGSMDYRMRWVRFPSDVRAVVTGLATGELSPGEFLGSLSGPTTFSLFSVADPLPSLVEPLLLVRGRLRGLRRSHAGA
jgi:predicted ATP-grasp superfamily ATP-dependent carboligase